MTEYIEVFKNSFDKFKETCCRVDNNVKIQSSKLFETFKEWLKENKIGIRINNNKFTGCMKQEYPEFILKKYSNYNAFVGICLNKDYMINTEQRGKEEKSKEEKDMDKNNKKKQYDKEYYMKNKQIIAEKKKQKRTVINQYDEDIIRVTGLLKSKLCKRKELGLVKYIVNTDGSLNVDETIRYMNMLVNDYIQTQQVNVRLQLVDTNKDKDSQNEGKGDVNIWNDIKYKYDIDVDNLTKESFIKFKQWYNMTSNDIWNLDLPTDIRNTMIDTFYEKYSYVDEKFDEIYENDSEYTKILEYINHGEIYGD